jgi:hypothetical protein
LYGYISGGQVTTEEVDSPDNTFQIKEKVNPEFDCGPQVWRSPKDFFPGELKNLK